MVILCRSGVEILRAYSYVVLWPLKSVPGNEPQGLTLGYNEGSEELAIQSPFGLQGFRVWGVGFPITLP